MTQDRLVAAYVEGLLSRRTFVRRLVATGVSLGAAVSYAHLLKPTTARAAAQLGDEYGVNDPPTVETKEPTSLYDGDGTITLNGRIDGDNRAASYYFRLGRPDSADWSHATGPQVLSAGPGFQPVSAEFGGLRPGFDYFCQLSASTSTGWDVGDRVVFRAPGEGLSVEALPPQGTADGDPNVTLRGRIDTAGLETTYYFRIGTGPEVADGSWDQNTASAVLPGSFDGPTEVAMAFSGLSVPDGLYFVAISAVSDRWRVSEALGFRNGEPPIDDEDNLAPSVFARVLGRDLGKVRRRRRLRVGVQSNEEDTQIKVRALLETSSGTERLGSAQTTVEQPYFEQKIAIPLSRAGRRALAGRNKAKIRLIATGTDPAGNESAKVRRLFELT